MMWSNRATLRGGDDSCVKLVSRHTGGGVDGDGGARADGVVGRSAHLMSELMVI